MLKHGTPSKGARVILFVAPGSGSISVVAGRMVGGSVSRNRARRILRAAWREIAPRTRDDLDVVLVARRPIRGAKAQDLVTEMTDLALDAGVTQS
ncbi:MAG: ribonuclease P protein component [Actinomycetota bacterium]